MNIQTPEWVKHAVFYQIFPDRFCRSPRTRHPRGVHFRPWGAPPQQQGFQGGDLYGVVEKLDYLKDLGITALYLNPIFSAASNHRYNTYDYLQVDPLLGGEAALRELLDEAHRRGMRVVLDGVFNHCGRGFWAFHHLLENGGSSPYADWFTVHAYPLHPYPASARQPANYAAWWNNASLPKFNTNHPGVRDYLSGAARRWLEFGMDGWRLDVPEEIKDDSFWREFRRVVKRANPQAYIVGEIWHAAGHWLQGDMFDAVMNYQFTGPVLSFFGAADLNRSWLHTDVKIRPVSAAGFRRGIETMLGRYAWAVNTVQLNMLDSHDMPRALWLLNGDRAALRLAVLCQMTMPGAPCVYYGDEVGLSAGTDPYCREAFPWHRPETWDHGLRRFYAAAIALRRSLPVLRTGRLDFLHARGRTVVFRRRQGRQEALAAFNAGKQPASVRLPAGQLARRLYRPVWPPEGGAPVRVSGGELRLDLPAQEAVVLAAG